MNRYPYVILGGGIVAGYSAAEFAAQGVAPGALAIVSAAGALPYERPPLSKGFLRGEESAAEIHIHDEAFYNENGIAFYGDSRVTAVDFDRRLLHTTKGDVIGFEKLIIATGATVRTLEVPGATGADVYYLRSLEDARQIRQAMTDGRRVVVVGSGFIGMEAGASLRMEGLETHLVFPEKRIWERFFTPLMSAALAAYYADRGVNLYPENSVARILRREGRVTGVALNSGLELPADFVVAGIGVEPATGPFRNSDLKIDDGIIVDEYLQTNIPGVYAAGDVARFYDLRLGRHRRLEHWDNAVKQGEYVARRCLGVVEEPYEHAPYFFSDIFDLSYEFWGDNEGADEVIYRGAPGALQFSVWWLAKGRVQGAYVMDRPDETRKVATRWVRERQLVDPRRLANGTPLRDVPV